MVFLHQIAQVFFGITGCQLEEQLTDLLLVRHRSDRILDPCDICIIQTIGLHQFATYQAADIAYGAAVAYHHLSISLCIIHDSPPFANRYYFQSGQM